MKRKIFIFSITFLFLACAIYFVNKEKEIKKLNVFFRDTSLSVEVADNDMLRQKGLSKQLSISENEGMLFIFDKPGYYSFWMKNMLFPIDIIFLDSSKKVTKIYKNIDPKTYPETFSPDKETLYVIETQAKFTDIHKVNIGDTVYFKIYK